MKSAHLMRSVILGERGKLGPALVEWFSHGGISNIKVKIR
jgi:hypothetical protein